MALKGSSNTNKNIERFFTDDEYNNSEIKRKTTKAIWVVVLARSILVLPNKKGLNSDVMTIDANNRIKNILLFVGLKKYNRGSAANINQPACFINIFLDK